MSYKLKPLAELFKEYRAKARKIYPKGKLLVYCHIFTDRVDDYISNPRQTELCLDIFKKYIKEYGSARLYIAVDDEDGNDIVEDCILAYGDFPV